MKSHIRLLLLTALFSCAPLHAFAAVRITEVAWMGVSGDSGQFGEWIELYNDGDASVNLSGWKLFGDGGGQLLFTLSKTIPSGGYLLVERTTASMPDPVPNIDDEHGTFGGGGLSNIGEDLVLKDANATVVQSLNFASGWPAGDAASKETMQWNGTSWVTGAGTPKSPTVTVVNPDTDDGTSDHPEETDTDDDANQQSESPQVVVKSSTKKAPVKLVPHIELTIPRSITAHVPYSFRAMVYTIDTVNPRGVYRWNFGDGTAVESGHNVAPVAHTYAYPGTYTIWFGYYDTVFAEDPILFLQTEVSVQSPELALSIIDGGALKITNSAQTKIDLSRWSILSNGYRTTIPSLTILAPHASIVIPKALLQIPMTDDVSLQTPDGAPVHATVDAAVLGATMAVPQPVEPVIDGTLIAAAPTEPIVVPEPVEPIEAYEPIAVPQTANSAKHWMLGAVALILVALFILLERLMAKRE